MLLMTLFFSVDSYWVGRKVGAAGLAAVSTSVFWVWMTISLAEMVSVGATAVAARRHGEGRHDEAARVAGEALLYALALGVVVAIIGRSALDAAFRAMDTPPEVTALGRSYLGMFFLGTPFIYGFFAVDAAFRSAGDTRTPFMLLAASVAVTLVLDPVLILGLWGAPRLGIAGAAIATTATRGVAFVLGLVVLHRRGLLHFGVPRAASLGAITRVGLPIAVTGITFSVIYVALTRTTTGFGTPALAAIGIGHRVESWMFMVGVGVGAAAAAIVGQNLGAGQVERAERTGWISVGYATALAAVMAAISLSQADRLAGIFSEDPAVVAEGARYLRIAALSLLFLGAEIILEAALGGAGDTLPPMLTSTLLTALRIPLAAWAAPRWGTSGIWWVISLTACARGIAMMALWKAGWWKRQRV